MGVTENRPNHVLLKHGFREGKLENQVLAGSKALNRDWYTLVRQERNILTICLVICFDCKTRHHAQYVSRDGTVFGAIFLGT